MLQMFNLWEHVTSIKFVSLKSPDFDPCYRCSTCSNMLRYKVTSLNPHHNFGVAVQTLRVIFIALKHKGPHKHAHIRSCYLYLWFLVCKYSKHKIMDVNKYIALSSLLSIQSMDNFISKFNINVRNLKISTVGCCIT